MRFSCARPRGKAVVVAPLATEPAGQMGAAVAVTRTMAKHPPNARRASCASTLQSGIDKKTGLELREARDRLERRRSMRQVPGRRVAGGFQRLDPGRRQVVRACEARRGGKVRNRAKSKRPTRLDSRSFRFWKSSVSCSYSSSSSEAAACDSDGVLRSLRFLVLIATMEI
jgi:hypothetical protein